MAVRRVVRWVIGLAILLVVLAGGFGVYAYATDYPVEATVKNKDCDLATPVVTVQTKSFGITHSVEVGANQCNLIHPGNYVIYHLRTQRTIVYDREGGRCLYDSSAAAACGTATFLSRSTG